MQSGRKYRKKQPRGCPGDAPGTAPPAPPVCGAGEAQRGRGCGAEGPGGKGWKPQTSCGKNLLMPGLARRGWAGVSLMLWATPGSNPLPVPGPSLAAGLGFGAAPAPPVLSRGCSWFGFGWFFSGGGYVVRGAVFFQLVGRGYACTE